MLRNLAVTGQLALATFLLIVPTAYAQGSDKSRQAVKGKDARTAPLVLAQQGSFFVNEQNIPTSFPSGTGTPMAGHISAKGMYVHYQIPQARNRDAYPIIMVHGSAHSGKTYEETPDGRMGWAEYVVRRGTPVYVVDHSGRARSGFDPSPVNRAKVEGNPTLIPGPKRDIES